MCFAIEYTYNHERLYATADARGSRLPVRERGGRVLMVLWGAQGRRFHGDKREVRVEWSDGCTITLDDIKRGAWADLEPRPVRIVAARFMVYRKMNEVTIDDSFALRDGEYLQGALLRKGTEAAVYVVTVPAPAHLGVLTPWPRIVSAQPRRTV